MKECSASHYELAQNNPAKWEEDMITWYIQLIANGYLMQIIYRAYFYMYRQKCNKKLKLKYNQLTFKLATKMIRRFDLLDLIW